jgi:hypothetical protein
MSSEELFCVIYAVHFFGLEFVQGLPGRDVSKLSSAYIGKISLYFSDIKIVV